VFDAHAVVVATIGNRCLVAAASPSGTALPYSCAPSLPAEVVAGLAADGVLSAGALDGGPRWPGDTAEYVGTPLTDRTGAALGAVLVARDDLPSAEDTGEPRLILDQLAHAVSISIENLRAYELEHRISLTLQRSLLPERAASPPGLDVAFRYEAAAETEVGGDFYELIELDDDHVIAAVGDVVGHSLQAAIVMADLRNGLRAYALDGYGPTAILERLDRLLRRFHPTITSTRPPAARGRSGPGGHRRHRAARRPLEAPVTNGVRASNFVGRRQRRAHPADGDERCRPRRSASGSNRTAVRCRGPAGS
jgi:hypothetical protein